MFYKKQAASEKRKKGNAHQECRHHPDSHSLKYAVEQSSLSEKSDDEYIYGVEAKRIKYEVPLGRKCI